MNTPSDIAAQAIDAIGSPINIGDIEEGTDLSNLVLRAYRQCLMQLLRAANWDFARKQAPLTLLADATGNTPNVGKLVIYPWIYEYALPPDCMKARFVPWNPLQNPGIPSNNIVPPNNMAPLMTGISPLVGSRLRPARFLIATDFNYPPPQGQITWEVQGVSPQGRTVVCTNVQQACLVYTALMLYPSVWDPQFRAAFVAYLASEIALPAWIKKDRKFGMQVRGEQIKIAKEKITQARITDGNEGNYSTDHIPDWLKTRRTGGGPSGEYGYGQGGGPGVFGYGNDACSFGDGSAY